MKYCDFDCDHAEFPDTQCLGACRTMAAVFCKKLGKVVPKHVPCQAEAETGEDAHSES